MLYKSSVFYRMHSPDLNLASSYIPACLCCGKCLGVFIFFVFSPVRGWIGLASMLSADRILWNRPNSIMDVNAICTALVAGLIVVHTRIDGVRTNLEYVIILPWMLLGVLQVLGVSKIPKAYEIIYAACAMSLMSCVFQRQDENEVLALRSLVFVLANVGLSYMGILLMTEDVLDTYVYISRTFLILLGDWRVATCWVAVYTMCLGFQFRSRRTAKQMDENVRPEEGKRCSEEAGLLREALARKGFAMQ